MMNFRNLIAAATLCFVPGTLATTYINEQPACDIRYAGDTVDQGLDEEEMTHWWFTGQGSQLIPYDWFLYLEQADSPELFRRPDKLSSYGYVYADPSPLVSQLNPDGLPIGLASSVDPKDGRNWLGPTCAACHSSEINYQGRRMIIDGAPTQADFWQFVIDVTEAMQATLKDDDKFASFARQLGNESPGELRGQLQQVVARRVAYLERNEHRSKITYGHGRVDAFGVIFNQVVAGAMKVPHNATMPDAPVSYPFLWGAAQADVVQWNGMGDNTIPYIGPISRNHGEVMGVMGRVDIDPVKKTVTSSALFHELLELEAIMTDLKPPLWPESFGAIDEELCNQDAQIFAQECHHCHVYISHDNVLENYRSTMVPLWEVGTDHKTAVNAFGKSDSAFFEGDPFLFVGPPLPKMANTFELVGQVVALSLLEYALDAVANVMLPSNTVAMLQHVRDKGIIVKTPELHYKARPLNGIWATAPYLHNGSVPNLRQMLWIEERQDKFKVGCTEYDPEVVGFRQDCANTSTLDTAIEGNTNIGHLKTQRLSDQEKTALLEFLKSL